MFCGKQGEILSWRGAREGRGTAKKGGRSGEMVGRSKHRSAEAAEMGRRGQWGLQIHIKVGPV